MKLLRSLGFSIVLLLAFFESGSAQESLAFSEQTAVSFASDLMRTTDMAVTFPPSPDPSGITYLPNSRTLLIVDGEVDEIVAGITHFKGVNVWELTLKGKVVRTANISLLQPTVAPITDEPTGITWNPNNDHYYVSDDDAAEVFDVNPGSDEKFGTADDTWTSFDTAASGSLDPEGIAFDTWHSRIFVADGVSAEIYEFTISGIMVNHFDTLQYSIPDPESVEFNPTAGTLFVMSSNASNRYIVETTTGGAYIRTIGIGVSNPVAVAGLAYAPASNGSGNMRFYIVDRGIDNNVDPNIIDGKMYEMTAPLPLLFKAFLPVVEKN